MPLPKAKQLKTSCLLEQTLADHREHMPHDLKRSIGQNEQRTEKPALGNRAVNGQWRSIAGCLEARVGGPGRTRTCNNTVMSRGF